MNKRISITIEGKTPLLMNRFTGANQLESTEGTRASIKTSDGDDVTDMAARALYLDDDGKTPIIPGPNLFRCIIDAGKFFKIGRSKVTTQKTSLIPSCVELEEIVLPLAHDKAWMVDTRPVRIPATGGRILRHRPCFHDWALTFTINLDTSVMSVKFFRDLLDKAGRAIGLGDFRPDCKGPFGKFSVTSWVVEK